MGRLSGGIVGYAGQYGARERSGGRYVTAARKRPLRHCKIRSAVVQRRFREDKSQTPRRCFAQSGAPFALAAQLETSRLDRVDTFYQRSNNS